MQKEYLTIYNAPSLGVPGGSVVMNVPANAGEAGLIPGSGWSLGGGSSNPLQSSCLVNPMDRGARWSIDQGVKKESIMTKQTFLTETLKKPEVHEKVISLNKAKTLEKKPRHESWIIKVLGNKISPNSKQCIPQKRKE